MIRYRMVEPHVHLIPPSTRAGYDLALSNHNLNYPRPCSRQVREPNRATIIKRAMHEVSPNQLLGRSRQLGRLLEQVLLDGPA